MADPLSRLTARLLPRVERLGARFGEQVAPAVRLGRLDLTLSRVWARSRRALRQELGPAAAHAYTDLVLVVAERDPALARVVAHALPDRLAAVEADQRRRYIPLLRAVARDQPDALPLVIRTLPGLLPRLDDASLARYLARGLELHRTSSRKAESFLRMESGEGRAEADRLQKGLHLDGLRRTLTLYARAHCGQDVQVHAGDGTGSDGRNLHLPALIDTFGDERDFLLYRVLTARAAGYIEYGTFDLDLSEIDGDWSDREPGEIEVERMLRSFSNRSLARDLFDLLEEGRVEARVRADYPGIARDMDRLDASWRAPLRDPGGLAPAEQAVEYLVRVSRGLEAPTLPDPRAEAAAVAAWGVVQERGDEASVADSVRALQSAYPHLDALLRRVDPDSLERIEMPDGDGTDAGGPGQSGDDGSDGEPDAPLRSPDPDRLKRRSAADDDYEQRPRDALEPGLQPEHLTPGQRQRETQALDLLDALREAEQAEADAERASLAELRRKAHDEDRSFESMAEFLQRNQGPSGPLMEERSPAPREDAEGPGATGSSLERDATARRKQFLYPEWDGTIQDHKPDWVRITEYDLQPGSADFVEQVRAEHGPLIGQIRRSFEALRPESMRRMRGVPDGDEIDLDRAIQARIARRAGGSPDLNVYTRHERQQRDVSVAFLVDLSSSTNEVVGGGSKRVIDIEKEALVLIAEAVDAIGDAFAIWGFSGYGRDQVAFYVAKDFTDRWSDAVRERVGAMGWKMENRDGAAIRHATWRLAQAPGRVKLLLLLSDGKPLDCGCDHYADRYAQADTRRALQEARAQGIHPFCITIDPGGQDYLAELYGETGFTVMDRVEALPHRLPLIYRRLTR